MLKITYLPLAELKPSPYNSNTHPADQVAQIANSIRLFGFTNPIALGKDNCILAGEGRYWAAKKLKMKQVPTVALNHLTETQQRAYIIADNKIAQNSVWDPQKLTVEISALLTMDFDVAGLGFNQDELAEILKDSMSAELVAVGSYTRTKQKTVEDMKGPRRKKYGVIVTCDDEEHQAEVYRQLTESGLKCKETIL